jgi:methylase of polypeptide subunit release factors
VAPSRRSWQCVRVPRVYFDERIAERYETYWPNLFEPAAIEPVVSFLADLAGEGSALEFGVGTGCIALPLSQRGVRVHGIDLSPAMVARLQRSQVRTVLA